jgi:hypothetical protein
MVEEVRRQFKEKPGIMDGTDQPDYAAPVRDQHQGGSEGDDHPVDPGSGPARRDRHVAGRRGVMGLLVGTLTAGFCVAIFMANAGGSWDNAKKYIEAGAHGGKGTDAHKAAVVGDTVGRFGFHLPLEGTRSEPRRVHAGGLVCWVDVDREATLPEGSCLAFDPPGGRVKLVNACAAGT